VVCLDEMGPQGAKSFPGRQLVRALPDPEGRRPAERARQEVDYGRRGKGYIFGAFQPGSGEAFTLPYSGRTTANWVDFLERVESWIEAEIETIYAVLDNLSAHRAADVLLFSLAHPRWEFIFQPKYAAYLNLIEPWWKVLRPWRSRADGSKLGRRSVRLSERPRPTGMLIDILSHGVGAEGTNLVDGQALPYCQTLPRVTGCTT
jgi:hypothetical protein